MARDRVKLEGWGCLGPVIACVAQGRPVASSLWASALHTQSRGFGGVTSTPAAAGPRLCLQSTEHQWKSTHLTVVT